MKNLKEIPKVEPGEFVVPSRIRCLFVKLTGKYPFARCRYCEKRIIECFGIQFAFLGLSIVALLLLMFTVSDLPALVIDLVIIIFFLIGLLAFIANSEVNDMVASNYMLRKFNLELVYQIRQRTKEISIINKQLEEANRLKTEFLNNVTHELRTPLTSIIGFSQVILEEKIARLSEEQKRYMKSISRNSRDLLALINNLLDSSKIEAGKMEFRFEWFDLSKMIGTVVEDINPLIDEKNIDLNISLSGVHNIYADKEKIRRVIVNLLHNAIKFTPEAGRISVESKEKDCFIEISITDTGIGVKKEDLEHIFEKFTKVSLLGTGLGLSISKNLIEAHGGSIAAESDGIDKGSRFYFALPMQGGEKNEKNNGG